MSPAKPNEPVRIAHVELLYQSSRYTHGTIYQGHARWWWELSDARGTIRAHGVADTLELARQAMMGAADGGRR